MLVFDTKSMTIQDIHLSYLKLRNKNRSIKYGVLVEGLLHQYEKLQEVYDTMKRLNFDYYFVDIENIDTKNILIEYQRGFTHANTHFENYVHFIKNSNIPSTQFVYSSLSLRCFKYTNDGRHPLQLADLVCHLTALLKYGGGICYHLLKMIQCLLHYLIDMGVYFQLCIFINLLQHLSMCLSILQIII